MHLSFQSPNAMAAIPLSSEWLLPLFILLLPLLSLLFLKPKNKELKAAKLPPSPPRLPIIGNLHQLGKLPHQTLWKLSQEYGPVMLLQLGSVPTMVVSSADMAKEILKTHDLDFCTRPSSPGPKRLSYNYLDVAFSPYSDYWREIRKLFVFELLSAKRVQSLWYAREAEVDNLITAVAQSSPNPVNLSEKIFILADSIVGTVGFGKRYGGMQFKNQKFQDVLDEAMNMLDSFSAEDFFPAVGWIVDALTGLRARLEKSFQNLDGYFQMVLDAHLDPSRPKTEHEDLVDVLIGLTKEQGGSGAFRLTKDHVKAVLMNTFIGGIDTSSVTMVWAMAELMRSPRVLKKVQAEIRSRVGKKPRVEADDVAKLDYLKMVVKETFRLHPAAPFLIPHQAMRRCKIGAGEHAYDVLPDTRVMVNAYAIGRDPKSWTNPWEFCPERFEGSEIDFKGQHFELIPFGAGRRICPGMMMGSTTVEFTLANLLYCFDWAMPSGMNREDVSMEEEGGITIHKKTPLYLVGKRYNWDA
ncbi:2-methylbutanal oxime monooxygenase-like [Malania oleifera]|uniref:CYP71E n=1 Tax=Malania oleifera TaxID=397392 RepID=A0A4Y5SWT2_MALOL|nr:2-methylbutanal oxime monooxygenase-like [Malania oleifera]QDA69651.1 CYP71E [Malania oleifera]